MGFPNEVISWILGVDDPPKRADTRFPINSGNIEPEMDKINWGTDAPIAKLTPASRAMEIVMEELRNRSLEANIILSPAELEREAFVTLYQRYGRGFDGGFLSSQMSNIGNKIFKTPYWATKVDDLLRNRNGH